MVAIDTKVGDKDLVHIKGGREATELSTLEWAKQAESLGAGEILLTSMDGDGTKKMALIFALQNWFQIVLPFL